MKKVLITGIRGFTGIYLRKALILKNYDVYGIIHDSDSLSPQSKDYKADITKIDQIKKVLIAIQPDYIIHLAAISFVANENSEDFYRVNVFGTLNILQAVQETQLNLKKILIASSANVYGNNAENKSITEKTCPKPVNHYGNSKLVMENMIMAEWFDKLPIIITRPFNYTGAGQEPHFLIPKIVGHFCRQEKVICLGNTDIIRDICDVNFVVESYIKLLEKENCISQLFNICSGRGYSIDFILDYLHKLSGYRISIEKNSDLVRKNEIKVLIGCNKKLLAAIGNINIILLQDILQNMYQSGLKKKNLHD